MSGCTWSVIRRDRDPSHNSCAPLIPRFPTRAAPQIQALLCLRPTSPSCPCPARRNASKSSPADIKLEQAHSIANIAHRDKEGAAVMEESPSSPTSFVVNSPRRTLSLLRERRGRATVSISDPEEQAAGFAAEHGPKPAEVYGFVGSITTVIATVIYLVWAYTPEPWLHSMGITYYPSKYWAIAVPAFVMVAVALVMAFYLGLNFMATPPPTSFSTMFDEYTRERSKFAASEGAEQPIEPISDIGINQINDLMFGQQA